MPDQHVGRRWWVRRTGWQTASTGVGTAAPADHGYRDGKTATASGLARQPRLARMSRTAVAMGLTVGGAWITVGTNGVVRVGAAALVAAAGPPGLHGRQPHGRGAGSEPGSATGSMATSAATGSTSTGAVVGSVTAGSTVVPCSRRWWTPSAHRRRPPTTGAWWVRSAGPSDRCSTTSPRLRVTDVEGSLVLTAGSLDDGSEAASDTVDVVVDGWSASAVAGVASVSGLRSAVDHPLRVVLAFGAGRLVGLRGGRGGRGRGVRRVLVGPGRRGTPDSVEVTPEEVASVVVSGAVALGCAAATGVVVRPGPGLGGCRDRSHPCSTANCPSRNRCRRMPLPSR